MGKSKKILIAMLAVLVAVTFSLTACGSGGADIDDELLGKLNSAIENLGEAEGLDVDINAESEDREEGLQVVEYQFKGNNPGSAGDALAVCNMSANDNKGKVQKGKFYIKDKYIYSDLENGKIKNKLKRGNVCKVFAMPFVVDVLTGIKIEKKEVLDIAEKDGILEVSYNPDKLNQARSLPQGMENAEIVGRYFVSDGRIYSSEVVMKTDDKTMSYRLGVNKIGNIEDIDIPNNLDQYKEQGS